MAQETELPPQAQFDAAIKALAQGERDSGIRALAKLRDSGLTSADLEANLGRALVEEGDLGKGIPLLMNSVALDRFDSANREDLAFAQKKVPAGQGTTMSHPSEWAWTMASYIRPLELLSLASLLLLFLIGLQLFKRKLKKAWLVGLALGSFAFVSLALFSTTASSIAVVSSQSSLRSAPLESAEEHMKLDGGTRLRVIRVSGDFAEVERTGSFRGWVEAKNLVKGPY